MLNNKFVAYFSLLSIWAVFYISFGMYLKQSPLYFELFFSGCLIFLFLIFLHYAKKGSKIASFVGDIDDEIYKLIKGIKKNNTDKLIEEIYS